MSAAVISSQHQQCISCKHASATDCLRSISCSMLNSAHNPWHDFMFVPGHAHQSSSLPWQRACQGGLMQQSLLFTLPISSILNIKVFWHTNSIRFGQVTNVPSTLLCMQSLRTCSVRACTPCCCTRVTTKEVRVS